MVEDKLGTNARRRARRNASAARKRSAPQGDQDRELALDMDYLAGTYGIDILDFAEVDWSQGKPKLRMRGRKRV